MINNPEIEEDTRDAFWDKTVAAKQVDTPATSKRPTPAHSRQASAFSRGRVKPSPNETIASSIVQREREVDKEMAKLYERYITQRKKTMAGVALNKNKVGEIFKKIFR